MQSISYSVNLKVVWCAKHFSSWWSSVQWAMDWERSEGKARLRLAYGWIWTGRVKRPSIWLVDLKPLRLVDFKLIWLVSWKNRAENEGGNGLACSFFFLFGCLWCFWWLHCDFGFNIATFPCGYSLQLSHSVLNNGFFQACTTCSLLPPAAAAATPAAPLLGRKFATLLLINSLLAARLYYGHTMLEYRVFYGMWPREACYA